MVYEIELLMRRGFGIISLMIDPFTKAVEPFDNVEVLFSITHKDFSTTLRFLMRANSFPQLCELMTLLTRYYDEKRGDVWKLPNQRVILTTLKPGRIYLQGTAEGMTIATNRLGLTINEEKPDNSDSESTDQ
jgi:hypothetical protein